MKDLSNKRFGKLTVLKFAYSKKRNTRGYRHFWECKCDCGNITIVDGEKLLYNHTHSCGCLVKEKAKTLNNSHNLSNTRLYKLYFDIKKRCYNSNHRNYKNYGARGIRLCKEWEDDFLSFYNWAINNGYKDNLTIDRIDVNGNYEPSNCRWVNQEIQQNNRRSNFLITYKNETHTLSEWCKKLNLNYFTVQQRFNKLNWSVEDAFTTPTTKGFIKNEYK